MVAKILLLDGPSLAYRAILGKGPELTSGAGEPTFGVLTFAQSLVKLLKHVKPTHCAVAWDAPRSQLWRREWFPAYKAKRDDRGPPPDGLFSQLERIQQVVTFWGLPLIEEFRWEADDVIASLADICTGPNCDAVIASSDKDMMQLVDDRVSMIHPTDLSPTYAEHVVAKWGVAPGQMIDLQTLMGDTVDGIPGVKGIGQKTAKTLIELYDSVRGVLDNLDALTQKQRERIKETDLGLMQKLVTLNRELNPAVDPTALRYTGLDYEAARPLMRALGFSRWT